MGDSRWYTRTTWTSEDREDFFFRIRRCRTVYNKSQYLRIQAFHLQTDSVPPNYEAALELLEMVFREAPDPSQLAPAYLQKANCLEGLGKVDEALRAYREAIRSGMNQHGVQTTDAPLHFGVFVVKNKLRDHYEEVLKGFKGSEITLLAPFSQYLFHSIMALIGQEDDRKKEAQVHAQKALEMVKQTGNSDPAIDKLLSELVGQEPVPEPESVSSEQPNRPKTPRKPW